MVENQRLVGIVGKLLQRIQALETLTAPRQRKDKLPIKPTTGTPLEQRSVQSEKGTQQKAKQPDFYDWVKNRYGSIQSLNEENRLPQSTHRSGSNNRKIEEIDRPKSNRLPVHKWSARYEGMDNGRKQNEFLKEVHFYARLEGFTEAELFVTAHHLFVCKARSWFMEVNGNNELGSWENLVREINSKFLPVDIDYQYVRLANARKQSPWEKFQDYYLDMVRIFRSMSNQ